MSCDWYENYASRYDRASMSAEVEETSILSNVSKAAKQWKKTRGKTEGKKKTSLQEQEENKKRKKETLSRCLI